VVAFFQGKVVIMIEFVKNRKQDLKELQKKAFSDKMNRRKAQYSKFKKNVTSKIKKLNCTLKDFKKYNY
jgi:hypothetical protein